LLDTDLYRRFDLGQFDIRVPAACLLDKDQADMFAEAALAILDLQRSWIDYSARSDEEYDAACAAFDALHKWVDGWSAYALGSLARSSDPDVLGRLGAKDNAREAHAFVQRFMSKGAFLGLSLEESPTSQVLLAPNRQTFLETLCFTGWNFPDQRAAYWKKGIEQWTSFWNDETQVIAMDYPAFPVDMKRPERGAPMDEFEKTGLGQHAAEKAAATMFWRYFGTNDALFFEAALATNLTIDVFGENNVRTGAPVYKNSGGSSSAFEVFVPGGNSAGGSLPGRGAVTIIEVPLWRETKGADYYVKPLQKAQRLGKKEARKDKHDSKDDRVHFIVHGTEDGDKSYMTAPFFGPDAKEKKLPAKEYLEDYEEFFRAYRAGFFAWLKTHGAGKDDTENAQKFATLTRRLATRSDNETFDGIVEELYSLPLSAKDGETDSLEWRFLTYVSKGGR
jgi:hypothetical protein